MDFRLYHAVNDWARAHAGLVHALSVFENVLVVLIVVLAVGLWVAARPGGSGKWKLTAAAGLASGALGFLVNQVIHAFWARPRPYDAHAGVWHPYANSHDASFPSDHSSAAYGIAWGIFLVDRTAGALFLVVATVLAWLRVLIGFHYPGDIAAGLVVGLAAAVFVVKVAQPVLLVLIRLVERLTDPILRPVWRRSAG